MTRVKEIVLTVCVVCSARTAWAIVDGEVSPHVGFEFLVSFQKLPDKTHFCGGAIISEDWIISAAECFVDIKNISHVIALAGCYNIDPGEYHGTEVEYPLADIIIHPNYSFPYNNIALIESKSAIELRIFIQSVRLRKSALEITGRSSFRGFGRTDPNQNYLDGRLMYLVLSIIENEECSDILNEIEWWKHDLRNTMLCALPKEANMGGCIGDQGGPLIKDDELVGIWNLINEECVSSEDIETPMVFTRITKFLGFINEVTDINIMDDFSSRNYGNSKLVPPVTILCITCLISAIFIAK